MVQALKQLDSLEHHNNSAVLGTGLLQNLWWHLMTPGLLVLQALRQLEALEQQQPTSRSLQVTVVGAGYAGIELATTLAERIGSRGFVQIIHGGACSSLLSL